MSRSGAAVRREPCRRRGPVVGTAPTLPATPHGLGRAGPAPTDVVERVDLPYRLIEAAEQVEGIGGVRQRPPVVPAPPQHTRASGGCGLGGLGRGAVRPARGLAQLLDRLVVPAHVGVDAAEVPVGEEADSGVGQVHGRGRTGPATPRATRGGVAAGSGRGSVPRPGSRRPDAMRAWPRCVGRPADTGTRRRTTPGPPNRRPVAGARSRVRAGRAGPGRDAGAGAARRCWRCARRSPPCAAAPPPGTGVAGPSRTGGSGRASGTGPVGAAAPGRRSHGQYPSCARRAPGRNEPRRRGVPPSTTKEER